MYSMCNRLRRLNGATFLLDRSLAWSFFGIFISIFTIHQVYCVAMHKDLASAGNGVKPRSCMRSTAAALNLKFRTH